MTMSTVTAGQPHAYPAGSAPTTGARASATAQSRAPAFVLPRPGNPLSKALLKGPILMWRLGLGPLLGRSLMILTTTGRRSGLPRRTAVGFHEQHGRKYVLTLRGPNTDWYLNMLADPYITIQTAWRSGHAGGEHAIARRVTEEVELAQAYDFLASMPVMRRWAAALGVQLTRAEVIAHKDDFILITFDPAHEDETASGKYPPPLQTDLWWIWPLGEAAALLGWLGARAARRPLR
jgi:deazaflavin-dependent oxidoreductase (nitroreductase family)